MCANELQTESGARASRDSARTRGVDGRFLPQHGAYALERRWVEGKLSRSMRRLVNRLRFEYALAKGFPSWASTPAPLRDAIDNAIRGRLLAARLFAGFWSGEDVPKRFDTVTENLRRQLRDLDVNAPAQPLDVARLLAEMREAKP